MTMVERPSSPEEPFTGRKANGIYEPVASLAPGGQAIEIQIVRKRGSFFPGFQSLASYWNPTDTSHEIRYLRKVYYCAALINGRPSSDQKRLLREAEILQNLDHPHIVRYEDFEWIPSAEDKAYLYMEYCPIGDLFTYLSPQNLSSMVAFSDKHFWKIFNQISSALLCCHTGLKAWGMSNILRDPLWTNPVLHRDVKPANVVIFSINDEDIHVKLCDFGLAKSSSSNPLGTYVGTKDYTAPEITEEHRDWTPKADIFSLGMTMQYILPKITNMPDDSQEAATDVIRQCVKINQTERPSAIDLLDLTRTLIYPQNLDSTTLHMAAGRGDISMVEYIVNLGANTSVLTLLGQTPLQVAATHFHFEIADYLSQLESEKQSDIPSHGYNLLHLAAWNGDVRLMKRLLKAKENAALPTSQGWTPLHLAAQNGHLAAVDFLLGIPVEVEPLSLTGFLPLHLASQNGHVSVVLRLLKSTTDVNARCKDGRTPLQLAKASHYKEVTKILKKVVAEREFVEGRQTRVDLSSEDSDSSQRPSPTSKIYSDRTHQQNLGVEPEVTLAQKLSVGVGQQKAGMMSETHRDEAAGSSLVKQGVLDTTTLDQELPAEGLVSGALLVNAHDNRSSEKIAAAETWMQEFKKFLAVYPRGPSTHRVKIALLDTGIDPQDQMIKRGIENRHIIEIRNFTSDNSMVDNVGHGTHSARLLSILDPCSSLFIAKVASSAQDIRPVPVMNAVKWALELKAEIIIIPFGFRQADERLSEVIKDAVSCKVVILAAAYSGGSNFDVSWPARMTDVIAVGSTDGYGNPSHFNPAPSDSTNIFAILGEAVKASGPNDTYETMQSGSSVAVVVAAPIVALVIQFIRGYSDFGHLQDYLCDGFHISLVLSSRGKTKNGYRVLIPWQVFDISTASSILQYQDDISSLLTGMIMLFG